MLVVLAPASRCPRNPGRTRPNTVHWNALDSRLSAIAASGHQAIFSTFMDYPSQPTGIPDFLSSVPGHTYNGGFRPDYNTPDLQAALLNYVTNP
jgi:hypothetical protein